MTMTREKMKEIQSARPKKRFFVVDHAKLRTRARDLLVTAGRQGYDPFEVWHKFLAPLTRDELAQVRRDAKEILLAEEKAKNAKEEAKGDTQVHND